MLSSEEEQQEGFFWQAAACSPSPAPSLLALPFPAMIWVQSGAGGGRAPILGGLLVENQPEMQPPVGAELPEDSGELGRVRGRAP